MFIEFRPNYKFACTSETKNSKNLQLLDVDIPLHLKDLSHKESTNIYFQNYRAPT